MAKKKLTRRGVKATAKMARRVVGRDLIEHMEGVLRELVTDALRRNDDEALVNIELEFPNLQFTAFTFDDAVLGDTVSLPRAAGRLNHKDVLAFFSGWLARHLEYQPVGKSEALAIADTLVGADTAIHLSVIREGWTEKEATTWLIYTLDNLVQSLTDELFESLRRAETLSQACPEYQVAYKQLIGREMARRESQLFASICHDPGRTEVLGHDIARHRSL